MGVEIKNHDRKFFNQFQIYQSVVNTAMSRPLRVQQMWDSFFMCMMRRSANFSVPGSGKTASVLGMYTFLKQTGEIQRIVVICPKNAFGSWIDEFSLCFGEKDTLRVLNLHDIRYPSVSARKSALKYDAGTANLILVNYESVNSVLDDLIPLVQSNSLLVFDEVHKVKRIGGEYTSAALVLAGYAAYLTAMTGTPFYYCVHLAEELARSGKRVIIWCIFLDSIQKLSVALEKKGIPTRRIYGTVPLEERQQILNEFKAGCFQVLLTNPHTLAESVSLHSICHDAIYYEYSYNLVHLLQSKDRIHRLGLPEGQYTQYTYIQMEYCTDNGLWSMEGTVYQRLKEKEQTMAEAIDHHILEVLPTSREDLEIIFNLLFKNKKLQYNDQ